VKSALRAFLVDSFLSGFAAALLAVEGEGLEFEVNLLLQPTLHLIYLLHSFI